MKMNFSEYFNKYQKLNSTLLHYTNALETYPPLYNKKLMGPEDDYVKAKQYLSQTNECFIKTLSLPEWQIVTLYTEFIFQKH